MKRLTVDRIEGSIAVCELDDGTMKDIDVSVLPKGIHEGSVLISDGNDSFTVDTTEENRRKGKLLKLQDSLFDKF